MIPKIIHQTWKTEDIPSDWQPLVESWKNFHPNWKYMFWSDQSGLEFVESEFPDFYDTYQSYSYGIQRADALRYLLLQHYGGLYVDMDFECLRSFDNLISKSKLLIGWEPTKHLAEFDHSKVICNALIASEQNHPFWHHVIGYLKNNNQKVLIHSDVLCTTGPRMLQQVFEKYPGSDISVAPAKAFYPLSNNDKLFDTLSYPLQGRKLRQDLVRDNCFAIHYWANSWVRNLAGNLINPNPDKIQGYTFFQGLDSSGNDLSNQGRDIVLLAISCSENENAEGFNTDGFIKHLIAPRHQWRNETSYQINEGLYVKNSVLQNLQMHDSN